MKKLLLTGLAIAVMLSNITPAFADADEDLAKDLATLFRAARGVIAANQEKINDPNVGDKGLSGDVVVAKAKEGFKTATGRDLDAANPYLAAELEAISFVMGKAQDLINEKGKGLKGFLPAVFAGQVATKFTSLMEGKAKIKLTAPENYVRNRKNRPDAWESGVIEGKFRAAGYTKDAPISEVSEVDGKSAFRFILPEYYTEACLACHGEPKGDLDVTGGKKEGGKLGELGGAISVVIFK